MHKQMNTEATLIDNITNKLYTDIFGPPAPDSPSPGEEQASKLAIRMALATHREAILRHNVATAWERGERNGHQALFATLFEKYSMALIDAGCAFDGEANVSKLHKLAFEFSESHLAQLDTFRRAQAAKARELHQTLNESFAPKS